MKNQLFKLSFLMFTVVVALFSSCKKDSSKPASFVDDYVPQLTEATGTTYSGNYYPFNTGYSWNWSGTQTTTGSMQYSAMGQNETEPMNSTDPITGYMTVNAPMQLTLNSGTYTVYPTTETEGLSRYFQVTDTALCLRAIKSSSSSSIIEATNSVYLRKPLIVGAKWKSMPEVDLSEIFSETGYTGSSAGVELKCSLFVIGKENITWKSQNKETLVVQERAQVKGPVIIDDNGTTGTINIDVTLDMKMNLLKDVGIIYEKATIAVKMSGTITDMGYQIGLNMNATMVQDLTLDQYNVVATSLPETKSAKANNSISYSKNAIINKYVKKILNSIMTLK
jgi:hypothetical protein